MYLAASDKLATSVRPKDLHNWSPLQTEDRIPQQKWQLHEGAGAPTLVKSQVF